MNEMKHHEMPQAVPDEKLKAVSGGDASGDASFSIYGSDGKWYAPTKATDLICYEFRCKFCGGAQNCHTSYCRAREAIRSQCQCCSNFDSGVLRSNDRIDSCVSCCRAKPAPDGR